jgi:hypothetical protein
MVGETTTREQGSTVDKNTIKAAIREELGRRVAMSGGPEVFRRLVSGSSELVDAALRELVGEGLLSETPLRVGRIYHYPANQAMRLQILAGFMKKMAEAPARPARPAHATAPPGATRPARDPNAPAPPRPAPRAAAAAPTTQAEATESDEEAAPPASGETEATAPEAAPPPASAPVYTSADAGGPEKAPWVPKRATPRDPNRPRPAPRAPVTPQPEEPDRE